MEAKDIEKYVCLVLAGKSWCSIKLCGNSKAIHLPVSSQYFPIFIAYASCEQVTIKILFLSFFEIYILLGCVCVCVYIYIFILLVYDIVIQLSLGIFYFVVVIVISHE